MKYSKKEKDFNWLVRRPFDLGKGFGQLMKCWKSFMKKASPNQTEL